MKSNNIKIIIISTSNVLIDISQMIEFFHKIMNYVTIITMIQYLKTKQNFFHQHKKIIQHLMFDNIQSFVIEKEEMVNKILFSNINDHKP